MLRMKAFTETKDAAGAAEPRHTGGTGHPLLPSLPEVATTGPSGHAQGQPRCTLRGNTASSPRVERVAFLLNFTNYPQPG